VPDAPDPVQERRPQEWRPAAAVANPAGTAPVQQVRDGSSATASGAGLSGCLLGQLEGLMNSRAAALPVRRHRVGPATAKGVRWPVCYWNAAASRAEEHGPGDVRLLGTGTDTTFT
jgi:hypothetical protein